MSEFVELIQEEKIEYITLEQFIPNWTEIIKEMDEKGIPNIGTIRGVYCASHGLSYNSHKFCLVGEAHKNNDDYLLNLCQHCSDAALLPASNAVTQGKETFQNFKLELFTHMLETHQELMMKHG